MSQRFQLSIASGLILVLSPLGAFLQADRQGVQDLSDKQPVSIDAQVIGLKLKEVASVKDNLTTRTTIKFSGKLGEYTVRPGTDVLVQLPEETRIFKFAPVGFHEEAIGGVDDDFPIFYYVRFEWNFNGAVRWTMYASEANGGTAK